MVVYVTRWICFCARHDAPVMLQLGREVSENYVYLVVACHH